MILPKSAASFVELQPGAVALPQGLLFLETSRSLVAADAHLGYEDVVGGALPLWSTTEIIATILAAVRTLDANEVVFLGDVIHGTRMSEGAARAIAERLDLLRAACCVTLIAGNHEGRTRGRAVLGETVDAVERDGWLLLHGDEPVAAPRCIIGHLHPSIVLSGHHSVPAFLASRHAIVVPALTPYSRGLNVLSRACAVALKPFLTTADEVAVVACAGEKVYPFGSLGQLRKLLYAERF